MTAHTYVLLIIASVVFMITFTVVSMYEPKSEEPRANEGDASQTGRADESNYVFLIVFICFLFFIGFSVWKIIWLCSAAPPKYVAKHMAQSYDPECLAMRLEIILEKRPLIREEVVEANSICNQGGNKGRAIRLQQRDAIKSERAAGEG